MSYIKECGDVCDVEKSRRFILKEIFSKKYKRSYRFVYATEGYECAGSAMRHTDEKFGVLFTLDGAPHGKWYKTFEEGETHFNRVTETRSK